MKINIKLSNSFRGYKKLSYKAKLLRLTSVLIFIYPLFGASIRDWFSGVVTLIALLGILNLFILNKNKAKFYGLEKNEIALVTLVVMLFVSFLVSGFINGWNHNQLDFFAGELNFLFFIPLYIIIREVDDSFEQIIKGTILSGILIFPLFFYEIIFLGSDRVEGAYSHLFTGPVGVLIAFISILSFKDFSSEKNWQKLAVVSAILSLVVAIYSKSGTAYALIISMSFLVSLFFIKKIHNKIIAIVLLITLMTASYFVNDHIRSGTDKIIDSVKLYYSIEDKINYVENFGSTGARFEIWLASIKIFKENTFVGIGRNNYISYTKELHDKGLISYEPQRHSHPHNIYLETLVSKGMVGFVVLMSIICMLVNSVIRARMNNVRFNAIGIIHLTFILIIGFGTAAPLIKNNFVSLFLLFSAIFFSYNTRELIKNEKLSKYQDEVV